MKVSVSNIENNFARYGANSSKKMSFSGRAKASKELVDLVVKNTSKLPSALEYLGKNDGEILNTIVVGLGTALVAPLFIAFNPFSKEDKETKMYSAWRQPISAVLAVAAQIGINKKYNQHLDLNASTGQYERANLSACPQDSYLRRIIKLEHPEYDKDMIKKEIERRKIDARWDAIDKARGELKNTNITYESLVSKKNIKEATEQLKAEFLEKLKEEFKSELEGKDNKFIDKFLEKKLKGAKEKEFKKLIDDNVISRATDIVKKQVEESAYIKTEVRKWINSANGKPFEALVAEKTAELAKMKNDKNISQAVVKQFESVLEKLKGYNGYENVKKLGSSYNDILQNVKIKQYVISGIDNAQAVLSSYRKQTGIVISLLTLPVSCGLLNWSYPRLMEKIMPNAGKKKQAQQVQPSNVKQEAKEVSK